MSVQAPVSTGHPDSAPPTQQPRRWHALLLVALPWVITALAMAVAVAATVQWRAAEHERRERVAVERAAGMVALALTNWDGTDDAMAAKREQLRSLGTERFAAEIDPLFGSGTGLATLAELGATSRGEVDKIYLESVREETAEVLAVVVQRITTEVTGSTEALLRFARLGMLRVGDDWLVDEVNLLVTEPGAIVFADEPESGNDPPTEEDP